MANYDFTYRTNYFRVKDEDAYQATRKGEKNVLKKIIIGIVAIIVAPD